MIAIVSQQFSIMTQLSFNLSPKQQLSKVPKPDERPLFPGLYLIIVYNYKTITVLNNSLNPVYPIAVAQVKPQPKDQIRVVLPFKLTVICRPKRACLTWGLTRGRSTHTCITWGFTSGCSTYTCLTWNTTRYRTTTKRLTQPSNIESITLLAYSSASCLAPITLVQFLLASINSD